MSIHPTFNLKREEHFKAVVYNALTRGNVTKGNTVKYLAEEIKTYYDVDYCTLFGSGTIAMYSVIGAMVDSWDFIIPSYTWGSVVWATTQNNKEFGYGDMNPSTYHLEDKVYNSEPDGIMIMDTYGSLASYSHLPKEQIIVDACHSFGTPRKRLRGVAEVFSFNGGKLMTTGEGGAVITNSPRIYNAAEYFSAVLSRMPNLSAGLGLLWFKNIDKILRKRKEVADYYTKNLNKAYTPQEIPIATNNYLYAVNSTITDKIMKKHGKTLGIRQYYNPPLGKGRWTPIANKMSQSIMCLPIGYYTDPEPIVDQLNEEAENESS